MDQLLWDYGTPTQRKYLEAVEQHGSGTKAAAALGVNKSTINTALKALRKKASARPIPSSAPIAASMVSDGSNKIFVMPDTQAKPGLDFSYLMRYGQYLVEKRPKKVVFLGDHADMPSLSSYDKGKKSFEGRRYKRDVEASLEAMSAFWSPTVDYNIYAEKHGLEPYLPEKILLLGNHEDRINRAVNEDPKLDGVLSVDDLQYEAFGFKVYPFLEVAVIDGIAFSHFFTAGVMGRPVTTAQACLTKKHMSCIQGHQQGLQISTGYRGDGKRLTSIICGSAYEHQEDYLGPQGNRHWRGFLMLHEVCDGEFDLMPVSLNYTNKKYAHLHVARDYVKNPLPELAPR